MDFNKLIIGKKGGAKGGNPDFRAPFEQPNTLQSVATAKIIDLISEGPILGLVDGFKSIFFDDVPIQNADGTNNFSGLEVDVRLGTPDQSIITGFSSAEAEKTVGGDIEAINPTSPPPPLHSPTSTISDSTVDAVRVKLQISSLSKTVTEGSNIGDLVSNSVDIEFQRKSVGDADWVTEVTDTIDGKTVSPYQKAYDILLPSDAAPHLIRLVRISNDDESVSLNSRTFFPSYTEITFTRVTYANSAIVGIKIDSSQFGSTIPQREYEIFGREILIPSNYDPITRIYSPTIWDGSFKTAWTDNPAWVLYDMLTNRRYGLGRELSPEKIDVFGLHVIAQYCDELVPDGRGGTEPRYTFNGVITGRQEAYAILQAMASNFRGIIYWSSNLVGVKQDSPATPSRLLSLSNIMGGFNYEGSTLKSRHSVIKAVWTNPVEAYEPHIAYVEDQTSIDRLGVREKEVFAVGTTSEGQAIRLGRWLLDTEKFGSQIVSFKASLDQAFVTPGEVIAITDPVIAGISNGGRISDYVVGGSVTVKLDKNVTLDDTTPYTLSVVLPDGIIESLVIQNTTRPDTTNILDIGVTGYTTPPLIGAMWSLSGDIVPREYRVISIAESNSNEFDIVAILHDKNKYSRIEDNLDIPPDDFHIFPTGKPAAPSDITMVEALYLAAGTVRSKAIFSWLSSSDPRVIFYEAEIKLFASNDPSITTWDRLGTTSTPTIPWLDSIGNTTMVFRIRGLTGLGGLRSDWVEKEFFIQGLLTPPANVTNFFAQATADGVMLEWDKIADLDLDFYEIRFDARIVGALWSTGAMILPEVPNTATSTNVPLLRGTYMIKAVDSSGIKSIVATLIIITNPQAFTMNLIETITEDPTFLGTHVNTAIDGIELKLESAAFMSSWIFLSDVPTLAAGSLGFTNGTYTFAGSIDLTNVFVSKLTGILQIENENTNNFISGWDFLSNVINMAGVAEEETTVTIQVRFTNDDPGGSPTWEPWQKLFVADYTARAFQFRVQMSTTNVWVTPVIQNLGVTIDMPDRIITANDITCPASGLVVEFDPDFKSATPAINVTVQDGLVNDHAIITNKDATGFDVIIKDGAESGVERVIDYFVRGWGSVQV